jgi:hypothetical protein
MELREGAMVSRWCGHCETEIEVPEAIELVCPICGLNPLLLPYAFDDAPAFFLADVPIDPQLGGRTP